MVGWVVWFASIVAAVLYAVGFGSFAAIIVEEGFMLPDRPMPTVLQQ
jgi:amino acid transporter